MYPTAIHAWFLQYGIDPIIGWEAIETAAEHPYDVENTVHLMNIQREYLFAMIDSTIDDPTRPATLAFLQHYVPMFLALAPYMDIEERDRFHTLATDADTEMIAAAIFTILEGTR